MTSKNSKKNPPKRHSAGDSYASDRHAHGRGGSRSTTRGTARSAAPHTAPARGAGRGAQSTGEGPDETRERSRGSSPRAAADADLLGSAPTATAPPRRRIGHQPDAPAKVPAAVPPDLPITEDSDSGALDSNDYAMLGIGSRILPPDTDLEELLEEESVPTPPPADQAIETPDPATVAARIRDLEARLDGMMRAAIGAPPEPDADATAFQELDQSQDTTNELNEETAVEAARELLGSDYYRRTWGKAGLRAQAEEVDDFGLDPDFEQRLKPLLKFLFKRYFRVETHGIDNIPENGRAVIVANHSGTLPLDGVMLREALREHHPGSRDLRWLAEDFIFYLPFIGVAMNRIGAVRACQENAQRLLSKDHLIAVFPEGEKGIKKLFSQRYQLQRFGRGGFIRLCLRTKSPLIPCAIVGAEETNPMLYRFDNASRLLGLEYVPVTPTFPWLGPLGLVPAPTKWRISFGEPIELDGYGPEAADDHVLIGRLSERVRTTISAMLDGSLRARRSVWL